MWLQVLKSIPSARTPRERDNTEEMLLDVDSDVTTGELATISMSPTTSAMCRPCADSPAAAALQIQAMARDRKERVEAAAPRHEHMQAALWRQMEVDQVAAVRSGGTGKPEHALAGAVEAAAATARLKKTSGLRRVRAAMLQNEAVRLAQAGEWGRLGQQGASATKKGVANLVTEARDRHSVY